MKNKNRIVSFFLALVMIIGAVFTPSPILANSSEDSKNEDVKYTLIEENGKKFKLYKLKDLGIENPEKFIKSGYRTRAAGDKIPNSSRYAVTVNWTTIDLHSDEHYPDLKFSIVVLPSRETIAETKDTIKGSGKYDFYETENYSRLVGYDESKVDRDLWVLKVPELWEIDIRLSSSQGGDFPTEDIEVNVTQRASRIYRADWFTNKTIPTIKAEFNNRGNVPTIVELNNTIYKKNQYDSMTIEDARLTYKGELLEIIKKGTQDHDSWNVQDPKSLKRFHLWIIDPDTGAKSPKGKLTKDGVSYYYNVDGNHLEPWIATFREELKVKFDPNGATFDQAVKPEQPIGHSMKIGESFGDLEAVTVPTKDQITNIPKKDNKDQELVGWVKDEASKGLDFSNGQNADKLVDPNGYEVKDNVTFYAVYAPKAQGKVAIQYVDKDGNAIDNKYKVQGVDYPKFAEGNKGEDVDAKSIPQPAFIGYERSGDIVVTGKKYDENGRYTVEVPYKKLDSIIPAKDGNGKENPKVTEDVKKHYAKVTYQVDTKDDEKAKLQLDGTDATSPLVYYVNPVEGIAIKDVAKVNAVSKDTNLYNVDANDMWTYNPDTITNTNQVISQATDSDGNVVKTEITLTAKVADKTAVKFKDKLDPQDIKVWLGDTIDWKKGVKLKEANEELQKILDKTETKVTDQSNRNSDAANLPNGQKGDLKVTFEDGSSLEVKDQTLYVAPHKNDDNTNLPKDAVKVDFKIGEGVTGTEKTEYVKPGINVKADAPKVTLKEGFKDAKWYKGDAEAADADYKVTADAVFTAKATGKDKVVKLDDPENPTNFPKDPTDNSKKDADYVTVKFVADTNGKIKEGDTEKTNGIAYAVLKNTEWADAVKAGVVVPEENATENNPKLVGKDKFYSFKEWQKDGAKVPTFAKVVADVTYTAVFEKATELTVTYNLNAPEGLTVGGTAPTDTDKYLKNDQVTVKALAADNTLAGYKFTGWNTQADGKGTAYAADAKFAIKANTELFAQWKKTAKDVIPVDNENDTTGKDGEEIPTNYVFVEFKVKDADADKANIKDGQQAKFKVDPKATVTLTAPELEVKEAFKVSHTAKFNEADYTNKKFEQATTIWASVSEKGKITVEYVFETNPKTKTLPDALKALKPENLEGDKKVYPENAPATPAAPDTSSEEAQKALIEKDTDGKKLGEWKAGKWVKTTDEDGNITYTLTWTFTEVGKSKQPTVNPVKPGDKKITGKGEPGSDIEVKIPDKDDPIKTTVDQNGDWTVDVPEDKKLKDGDKVIVTQTEKDKKTSDPVEKTVTADKKPEPKPEPVPEVEIPGIKYKDHYTPTYPVYVSVPDKKAPVQDIFTHEQYIFGYPDDTIRPDGDMTRAEAIAVVARLQKLDLSDKTSNIYKDTKAGMWYNAAINAAFREGYLLEKEGENIRPNDKITRAELALLISHIDKKNDKVAPFEDVKGHKFEAAINQAYGNERIKGYPDGTFKPDNSITRAEVATMLNKLYDRYPDKNFIDANQNLVHNYKDMSYKGHWGYYELVEAYHTHKFARLANNMEEWKAIIK